MDLKNYFIKLPSKIASHVVIAHWSLREILVIWTPMLSWIKRWGKRGFEVSVAVLSASAPVLKFSPLALATALTTKYNSF